jgi:DNA polymerase/3'-5' exonuclease PolX
MLLAMIAAAGLKTVTMIALLLLIVPTGLVVIVVVAATGKWGAARRHWNGSKAVTITFNRVMKKRGVAANR